MKFSQYMQSWLFDNYYKKGVNIGKNGDFYTATSLGSMFGIIISNYIIKNIDKFSGNINIVEIGANEGHLICDIVQGIYTLKPDILDKISFCILEPFEKLKEIQSRRFFDNFGDKINLKHIDFNANLENAFIISNELFDSFACDVVDYDKILMVDDGMLHFEINNTNFGFKGEVANFDIFIKNLSKLAKNLHFISFDYGFTKKVDKFSLRIYQKHKVYNPFELQNLKEFFGKSDITYDVDFARLGNKFIEFGFNVLGIKSQANALLDFGAIDILKLIEKNRGFASYQKANLQLKHLLYGFGEKFKMIEVTK